MGGLVKVKRDGPRGWHWIDASRYDPAVHALFEEPGKELPAVDPGPVLARRGRPPKPRAVPVAVWGART